jgi:hypothetical protein
VSKREGYLSFFFVPLIEVLLYTLPAYCQWRGAAAASVQGENVELVTLESQKRLMKVTQPQNLAMQGTDSKLVLIANVLPEACLGGSTMTVRSMLP